MSEPFDAYHRWLGIPPKEQPANHYRLLGLALFEADPEVVRNAAERQMGHVRSYGLGRHAALSQKILNELAGAKACLLDPEKKAAYDARLQEEQELHAAAGRVGEPPDDAMAALIDEVQSSAARPGAWQRAGKPSPAMHPTVIGGAAVGVLLILGLIVWAVGTARAPEQQAAAPADVQHGDVPRAPPRSKPLTGMEKSDESKSPRPTRRSDSGGEASEKPPGPGPDAKASEPARPGEAAGGPPDKLSKAIELAGDDPIALIERGRSYAQQGKQEKAEADFARARSPGPGRRPALAAVPFSADQAAEHQRAWAEYLGAPVQLENSIGMKLRLIPPGMFTMGTPEQARRQLVEEMKRAGIGEPFLKPVEEEGFVPVFLTEPFYVGQYEVTVGQFRKFVEDTGYQTEVERSGEGGYAQGPQGGWVRHPSHIWKSPSTHWQLTDEQPVVHIGWHDALAFCDWLSHKESRFYILPTEAQWELACRGGSATLYGAGDDPAVLEDTAIAWNPATHGGVPHAQPVGTKKANAFGLHDMLGNAGEWCADGYAPGITSSVPLVNPLGPTSASAHVWRGGKWYRHALISRCGYRESTGQNIDAGDGFRVLLKVD